MDIETAGSTSFANKSTKSFQSETDLFTESMSKKAESESLEKLKTTLRNIQVNTYTYEFNSSHTAWVMRHESYNMIQTVVLLYIKSEYGDNQLMPIQLNIFLGKDIVDAQIQRLEELQQFFENKHLVDKEKIAKIQSAFRDATI